MWFWTITDIWQFARETKMNQGTCIWSSVHSNQPHVYYVCLSDNGAGAGFWNTNYRCLKYRLLTEEHTHTHTHTGSRNSFYCLGHFKNVYDDDDDDTHTHPFNGPLSGTTRVGWYQKGETNLDFTEARDSEWQWHQLGHMHVCTLHQTDNHASTPPLGFFTGRTPFLPPNQQRQSTEGINRKKMKWPIISLTSPAGLRAPQTGTFLCVLRV